MSGPVFDARHVRRAFSRSAGSYDAAAQLQHVVEARLLESLDYLDDPALQRTPPQRVLDLGCGTGRASVAMQKRWPKAQVLSLDLALPMLQQARLAAKRSGGWLSNPFARVPQAKVVGVDGAKHLWVGEKYVRIVLDALVAHLVPGSAPLPDDYDGPMARCSDL